MSTDGDTLLAGQDMPGIYIKRSSESITTKGFFWNTIVTFDELVRRALADLRSNQIGKQLVALICDGLKNEKKIITIEAAGGKEGQSGSGWDREDFLLRWSPVGFSEDEDDDQLGGIPASIILGHELIHAWHTLEKTDQLAKSFSDTKAIEEARTIGLGRFAKDALTENSLRRERGIEKLRTKFCGITAEKLLKGTDYA